MLLKLAQKWVHTRDTLELSTDTVYLRNQWAWPQEQFCSLLYDIAEWENISDEDEEEFYRVPRKTLYSINFGDKVAAESKGFLFVMCAKITHIE